MIDILMIHGIVITMDPQRRILADGAVAVENGRIAAVGPTEELMERYPDAEKVMDCRKKLILPGFIDVHSHAGHCMLKGLAYDTPTNWMPILTHLYHQNTTDEFWYKEGRLGALERLKFGVTCGVCVMSNAQRSDDPVFAINHAKGYSEVGIREIVAVGPSNPPYPRKFTRFVNGQRREQMYTLDALLEGADAAIGALNHTSNDRIRAFMAPFVMVPSVNGSGFTPPDVAPVLTDLDRYMTKRAREIASKHHTRIHTEAFGGMIRLAAHDENALLGPDVHLHHCLNLTIDEMMILAETKTNVSSSPGAFQLANRCPVPELIGMGVNVAIATDGTSPGMSFDLIEAARKLHLAHQVALRDRFYMPLGKVLEMITIDAAKAIGWDNEIGSLEVGKKADIITLNMNQPHLTPNFMPVHKLLLYGAGQDVDNVIVDGRLLMENRAVQSVSEEEIMVAAEEEAIATIRRAGAEKYLAPCDTFWGNCRVYCDTKRFDPDPAAE